MVDLILTADAAWTGATTTFEPIALGIAGERVAWVGTPEAAGASPAPRLHVEGVLLPGLVDHHVHSAMVDLGAVFGSGLTTVVDLGWAPEEIWPAVELAADPRRAVARIRAAGPFMTLPGGYPTRQSWAVPGIGCEVADPRAAVAAVRSLAQRRPATIKVALNSAAGPVMSDDMLRAIVAEAQARGLTVTAHVEGAGQTERAVRAGVHVLAHTPWTERLDDALIAALARRTTVISTIDIHGWGEETPERRVALDNLRHFHRAGGTVRYGTDLGNGPLPEGVNARELDALRQVGLTPAQIVAAMSGRPFAPGRIADVVAVPADPAAHASALLEAVPVLKGGVVVKDDAAPAQP